MQTDLKRPNKSRKFSVGGSSEISICETRSSSAEVQLSSPSVAKSEKCKPSDQANETKTKQSESLMDVSNLDNLPSKVDDIPPEKAQFARKLFNLPPDEELRADVFCLKKKQGLYMSGRLYVFQHYICFYSTKWGLEVSRAIPLEVVKAIRKKRHMGASNSIEVAWVGKRTDFINVRNRGQVYNLMLQVWKECNASAADEFLADPNNLKAEKSENNLLSKALHDWFTVGSGPKEEAPSEDGGGGRDDAFSLDESQSDDEMNTEDAQLLEMAVKAIDAGLPMVEARPACNPATEENWQLLGELLVECSVKDFTMRILLTQFIRQWQESQDDCRNASITSWVLNNQLGLLRELNFWYVKKLGFGVNECECHQTQWLSVHKDQHVVLETDQVMPDIPFGDYFSVQSRWDVKPEGAGSCRLKLYGKVKFSRSTVFKKQIDSSSMASLKKNCESILVAVTKALQPRKKGGGESRSDLTEVVASLPEELKQEVEQFINERQAGTAAEKHRSLKRSGTVLGGGGGGGGPWSTLIMAVLLLVMAISLVLHYVVLEGSQATRTGQAGSCSADTQQLWALVTTLQQQVALMQQQVALIQQELPATAAS